ncbi:cell division protein FtsL [Neptunomonas antarctica]|uniref:Cell division protein FtsL n=1 Tax=Neptunomonas antarctica TaxID=619304 RepID=A0A1N7PFN6_9GAMM|nr:cell division protein FtsL [Neptunomonas antarctica]
MFSTPKWLSRNKEKEAIPQPMLSVEAVARPVFVVAILVVLIVCSALAVTYEAFQYRNLFNKQQIIVQQWDGFQVEWGQLLLEQSALGANNRVERVASKQLNMIAPQPSMIEIVQYER